jgi:hypothetical protein
MERLGPKGINGSNFYWPAEAPFSERRRAYAGVFFRL